VKKGKGVGSCEQNQLLILIFQWYQLTENVPHREINVEIVLADEVVRLTIWYGTSATNNLLIFSLSHNVGITG
jgi:hypothetical protein